MKIGNITSKTQILYIVLASAIFCALVFSYIRQVNIDEREHLYSSFMVYRGFLPYKDFFQHHHPLLWYAFAPFLIFFNNTPYIWYVMRVFNLFVLLLTGYYTSKITYNITQNKPTSIITAIIYLNFPHVLMSGVEFRPDNLMMLFFISGLYYLLEYLKNRHPKKLLTSYLLFLLSFLTLQKIIILLFGVFLILLSKTFRPNIKQILSYSILPILLFILYIAYLYHTNTLKDYYETCWILNIKRKITYTLLDYKTYILPTFCAIISIFNLIKSTSLPTKIISFLFIIQFIPTINSPYPQYLLSIYPFMSIIFTIFLNTIKTPLITLFLIIFCFYNNIINSSYLLNDKGITLKDYIELSNTVLSLSTPNDIIINDYLFMGGLRKSAYGYYWYGHDAIALLDYRLFKRRPWPDLLQIIHSKKPKLVANSQHRICLNDANEIVLDCQPIPKITLDDLPDNYIESELMFMRTD